MRANGHFVKKAWVIIIRHMCQQYRPSKSFPPINNMDLVYGDMIAQENRKEETGEEEPRDAETRYMEAVTNSYKDVSMDPLLYIKTTDLFAESMNALYQSIPSIINCSS
ncbi:hypothetical protein AMTRI_Chr04g186820 [Amborella trichopoda]